MKPFWTEKNTALVLIVISVGLRFFSFFPSVLDHDESTYLIIGRDILNGKALYTDVTDTKPAGIFIFYAMMEFIFGGSIFLKRFVFALVVGFTSFLVYKVSMKFFNNQRAAFASGLIYIFYTSVWVYHGRSPNTELLFNLTTIGALLLFLRPKMNAWFMGGFLMGIGFIIKYLVLFDLAAFLLFFFFYDIYGNFKRLRQLNFWGRYMLAGITFLMVFGLLNLYFWLDSPLHDFFYVTYELPENYGSNPSLKRYGIMLLDFTAKFLPISFFVFYVVSRKDFLTGKVKWFFITWVAGILIAIYLPGKEFSHYTIQLMLPLSLIGGLFFHPEFKKDKISAFVFSGKTGLALLAAATLVIQVISFESDILNRDYPREVAQILEEELDPGEQVYIGNYEQIVYYLLEMESPTRYIHPNLIFTDTHKAFKIDVDKEIKRIMDKSPEIVVIEKEAEELNRFIESKYSLLQELDNGKIRLYRLI